MIIIISSSSTSGSPNSNIKIDSYLSVLENFLCFVLKSKKVYMLVGETGSFKII